jgi:asparagine synthase (glutamine-hydrolysing)
MCGITGYARARSSPLPLEGQDVLRRMTAALTHRGPDACGFHTTERLALGHRRLSVIDLTGGAQPMRLAERGLSIVYNGEIYNYPELNGQLAARGFRARTRSDTETILLAYAAWGEACVEKFNGMFAFLLHDAQQGKLFAARDRMGEKPFYYVHDGSFFAFASEPKALLQHPAVRRELDLEALARYLLFEYVPSPYAIYAGMRKLEAGQALVFDLETAALRLRRYWEPSFETAASEKREPEDYWVERIREQLQASVRRRLISDVPLGVFLSGGIDSSAVTAAMVKLQGRGNVKTFTIGFSDPRFDETAHARALAGRLGTEHYEEQLDPRASQQILPAVSSLLDEPFADPSILPCYLLSRFTRRHVTVALGGDGGDEMFAGYDTFRALRWLRLYNALVPGLAHRAVVKPLAERLPASTGNFAFDFIVKQFFRGAKVPEDERLWRWLGAFVPEELAALLAPEVQARARLPEAYREVRALNARVAQHDPVVRDAHMFARTYLEQVLVKVDRSTMACSLEPRAPLLDPDFVALANGIPSRFKVRGGRLKHIFKKALRGLVPESILARPKKGFGIPVASWFREDLRELMLETLSEKRLREAGLFRPEAVKALIDAHLAGRRNNRKPLWVLFMFELWREKWLKPPAPPLDTVPLVVRAAAEEK